MKKHRLERIVVPAILVGFAWWIFQDRQSARRPIPAPTHRSAGVLRQQVRTAQLAPARTRAADRVLSADGTSPAGFVSLPPDKIAERRSAIKLGLTSVYTAQRLFFEEHKRYSTDLFYLGISFSMGSTHKSGFLNPFHPGEEMRGEQPDVMNFDAMLDASDNQEARDGAFSDDVRGIQLDELQKYCRNNCTASDTDFEVISATNFDSDPTLDIWLIDDSKTITHVSDDTKD